METHLIEHAKTYLGRNLSVIPTKGDKRALIKWEQYQKSPLTPEEARRVFGLPDAKGIAVICGKVSGNLEVIDIDCKNDPTGELWSDLYHLAKSAFPDLLDKLVIAKTINKGYHFYYRCKTIERNQPLSKNKNNEVLIETRSEGGYVIAAPSEGYQFVQGDTGSIPEISTYERMSLLGLCRSFNETLTVPVLPLVEPSIEGRLSPFEDFNQRSDVMAILTRHSWRPVREKGGNIYLTRPGKSNSDVSASYNTRLRIFYVFTTSSNFEANRGYNAVQVYTIYEANNDYSRASHQLYEEGYGDRYEQSTTPSLVCQPVQQPEVSSLPIDGFPQFLQDFITTCADTYRTPRDYWAGAVMIATALGIGDKLELVGRYQNLPVFWLILIGDVSSGKSHPLEFCLNFFRKLDSLSDKNYKIALSEYERVSRMSEKERKQEGLSEKKPGSFLYIVKDSTPEGISSQQEINSRGMLVHRDELKGMLDDFNRYNRSGEQSNLISSWSGQSMSFIRKTAGNIFIDKPCLSICGTMQPDLLYTLANDNRAESGFLSRVCPIFPNYTPKPGYCDDVVPESMVNQWEQYLSRLINITEKMEVKLNDESRKIYADWFDANAEKINKEKIGYLKGVYGKLDIIALRLAILLRGMNLSCDGTYSDVITKDEMESAISITEYFRTTALKVYAEIFENKPQYTTNQKTVANYLIKNVGLNKSEAARALKTCRAQVNRVLIE